MVLLVWNSLLKLYFMASLLYKTLDFIDKTGIFQQSPVSLVVGLITLMLLAEKMHEGSFLSPSILLC